MGLRDFASKDKPIRCSKISEKIRCPIKAILDMDADDDLGGTAAQIGSVVHCAAEAFHRTPEEHKRMQAGLKQLQDCLPRFPAVGQSQENISEAMRHFTLYAQDPRNIFTKIYQGNLEKEMRMSISPHELDPTGEPIYLRGTLDQIREVNTNNHYFDPESQLDSWLEQHDIKTGKPSGFEMMHEYAMQQAAYFIMARAHGIDVRSAWLIRTNGYRARSAELPSPQGVFWSMQITERRALKLLDHLRLTVAMIRSGELNWGPSPICTWCDYNPWSDCMELASERFGIGESDAKVNMIALPTISDAKPHSQI